MRREKGRISSGRFDVELKLESGRLTHLHSQCMNGMVWGDVCELVASEGGICYDYFNVVSISERSPIEHLQIKKNKTKRLYCTFSNRKWIWSCFFKVNHNTTLNFLN